MSEPQLTTAMIRNLATDRSYSRGEDYYHTGAVYDVERRGQTLLADVQGSSYEPYHVTAELDADGAVDAYCSCPYDWGGYCKHIVAVLLAYVHKPETITERLTVADLLDGLERDDLADLLSGLLEDNPHLIDWVEGQVAVVKQAPEQTAPETETAPRQRSAPIDPAPFGRQARAIMSSLRGMRASEAYWHIGGLVNQLGELVQQAQPFLQAGDGRNALLILEAVAEVYVDRWLEFDDSDGDLGSFFSDLGFALAEAILSADLSKQERDDWADRLTAWQNDLDDYGIEDGFNVAIAAAVQGWDHAPLQRVLQGHVTQQGAWEDEAPWYANELTLVRLNVLENQGRTEEYLRLAEAEGQTACYVTMLVKLGRGQEAVAYGLQYLGETSEALALAQALREHDLRREALQIAEHGLSLHGHTHTLARWLRDFAAGIGQAELALQAARAAFTSSPSLDDYQAARPLAGADWPQVKADLLKHLAAQDYTPAKVDIYLHEGMVDEAVKAVDEHSYGYDALERVVDAAYESHPDWVIRKCQAQAERIMDAGQSKYYHHAANWLGKARRAYLAAGRDAQWSAYLEDLISKHARKYALRPRLEDLRK